MPNAPRTIDLWTSRCLVQATLVIATHWASFNEIELSSRGRVPAGVIEEYIC